MPEVVYLSEVIKSPWYGHVYLSDIIEDSDQSEQSN